MAGVKERTFYQLGAERAFDRERRVDMNSNFHRYEAAVDQSLLRFNNLENAKRKAHLIKWKIIENLDRALPDFESNFQKRGGKVLWANDAHEALEEIQSIIRQEGAKKILKSRSSVADEIGLVDFLAKQGIEAHESDERLEELNGSKELRKRVLTADVGITGANFLIADSGGVAISENAGNVRLCTTFPRVHIVIAGIEKVIPSAKDLDLFLPLLSAHGTGQKLTRYTNIYHGPRQAYESDGPEKMYVILLDNGRTNLLAQPEQREGLYCIRCGACLEVCPVFRNVGAESYQTTYGGPIGSLITPHTQGVQEFHHLSQASTLCGKCTSVCPVKINIDRMLILNRRDAVQQATLSKPEAWSWNLLFHFFKSRKKMDFLKGKVKSFLFNAFLRKKWGKHRKLPTFEKQSFASQWKSNHKDKPN